MGTSGPGRNAVLFFADEERIYAGTISGSDQLQWTHIIEESVYEIISPAPMGLSEVLQRIFFAQEIFAFPKDILKILVYFLYFQCQIRPACSRELDK